MKLFIRLFVRTLSVFIAAYVIPGVSVDGVVTALIVAVVLGVLNVFIKPILVLLTLPITIITLGLFYFLINVCLIILAATIVPGFNIDTMLSAVFFGIALAFINSFLAMLLE